MAGPPLALVMHLCIESAATGGGIAALCNHQPTIETMSTLEAAAEYGTFTTKQLSLFLAEHGLSLAEAEADLGDSAYDAVTLCEWIGY